MIRTQDGGFAMVGWQNQKGIHDTGSGLIVVLNEDGSVSWKKTLETTGRNQVATVLQRADSSFVAVVEEYPTEADEGQVVLIELSTNGDVLAQHRVGGPGSDVADSILQTHEGGYVLAGESAPIRGGSMDAWVAKLSPKFELEWEWRQGTEGRDRFNALILLEDGSMVAAGNTTMPGPNDRRDEQALLVKFSSNGTVIWSLTPLEVQAASIRGLTKSEDGGFMFAGFSKRLENRNFDSWVGKVSSDGSLTWEQSIELEGGDYLHSIQPLADGTYIAGGAARTPDTAVDALVIEVSEDGSRVEPKSYAQAGSEEVRAVLVLDPSTFVLAGARTPDNTENQQMWFAQRP